ncbi:MAG: MmcQ/YjbR family DNA-binding protein [Sulfurimonadaceae bacterium]
MTKKSLEKYCLSKSGAVKEYPFDKVTAVYKVGNKMFALASDTQEPLRINLKCEPLYAAELRSIYDYVIPGYYMNKKHWNTVICNREADDRLIEEWIDDSYGLVFRSLTKKLQNEIISK